MSDANTVMEKLCSHCADYLKNLPTSEKDTRVAALVAWCLAYKLSLIHISEPTRH